MLDRGGAWRRLPGEQRTSSSILNLKSLYFATKKCSSEYCCRARGYPELAALVEAERQRRARKRKRRKRQRREIEILHLEDA